MEETLESEDNNGISVFDKVLNYQPLLTKILTFVNGPPVPWPKPLLPLRLLSSAFNDAILNLQGGVRDLCVIKFRLPMSRDEDDVSHVDGRLCKDVVVGCRCDPGELAVGDCLCSLPQPPLFTPFAIAHGFNVLELHVADTSAKDLATFLILINKHFLNLTKLIIDIEDLYREIGEARKKIRVPISEFEGSFDKLQNNLRTLQLNFPEYRGSATRRHVAKVMTSFLSVTVDLEQLIIEGDLSLDLDTQKLAKLTSFKHTNNKIETVESQNGVVGMVTAVANTLEKLEVHRQSECMWEPEDMDYFGMDDDDDLHPIPDLPTLKAVSFSLIAGSRGNDFYFGEALWDLILQGRAKCLETVKVDCIERMLVHFPSQFWTCLFNDVRGPITTVRTLSIQGFPAYASSDAEKLRTLHQVFPNLNRIAYPVGALSGQQNRGDSCVHQIVEVLQSLSRWDRPFKEIQISLEFDSSINDVAAAFEIIGADLFANGLETLRIGTGGRPEGEVLTENQFQRLTRTLRLARNLLNLTFHGFTNPTDVAERLGDFIANNRLPVTFSEQGFPEFE